MTLELYTDLRKDIELRLDVADKLVKSFPVGAMGLVKMTDEFKVAKRNFDSIFNELRELNASTNNKIKRDFAVKKRFSK